MPMLTQAMLIALMIENPPMDTLLEPMEHPSLDALRNPHKFAYQVVKQKNHAMSECAQEIKFARNLLTDLELSSNDVIPMQVDSKLATTIAEIPRITQGNKHFDVCDHFI